MDLREIKRLLSIVEEAKVSHFSVETDGMKIEIKKEQPAVVAPSQVTYQVPSALPSVSAEPVSPSVPSEKADEEDKGLVAVSAQMVGTFYEAPSPDAAPFVKVGDRIQSGQVICIIEAMKLFNEIESEISGVVEKICVDNASPVEYGQDLFLVRVE